MFKENDCVTRKSYNDDIVFKILYISHNLATLQGVELRIKADAYIDDLNKANLIRSDEDENLPINNNNYLNGKILHLDGDGNYLKQSMRLYEKYKVPAIGYRFDETLMASKLKTLLNKHHPDILVITGHDAIDKNGNNINTSNFVKCVKVARDYQPNKDALCIISGACFSSFKKLIYEGSNISSSPGKVSINVLDPSKVAIIVATTLVSEYVDINKAISLTSNKEKGMGGIDTKGVARRIY